MNREYKSGRWRHLLHCKTKKLKSLLRLTGNYMLNVKVAGRKPEESERPSNTSYIDSIYNCPLSVYIDITCDNKTESLIITGSPTAMQLEEAKLKLMSEFSEASNNELARMFADTSINFFLKKNRVMGLELALRLILATRYEYSIDYLNRIGIACTVPGSDEDFKKLVKKIQMAIKNGLAKLKEAGTRYNSLSAGKAERPTRKYYNRLLIILSTCEIIKIQLNPKKMMVSEFAEYLNLYNEYQNQLKMQRNGKH